MWSRASPFVCHEEWDEEKENGKSEGEGEKNEA